MFNNEKEWRQYYEWQQRQAQLQETEAEEQRLTAELAACNTATS